MQFNNIKTVMMLWQIGYALVSFTLKLMVEDAVTLELWFSSYKSSNGTTTSRLCRWNEPSRRQIVPRQLSEIPFEQSHISKGTNVKL